MLCTFAEVITLFFFYSQFWIHSSKAVALTWDWHFLFLVTGHRVTQPHMYDVGVLWLFLSPWCYWSWPSVSNPLPLSRPCGQHYAVIRSEPEVFSQPWMNLCVVLPTFGSFHHQLHPPCDKGLLWYCRFLYLFIIKLLEARHSAALYRHVSTLHTVHTVLLKQDRTFFWQPFRHNGI